MSISVVIPYFNAQAVITDALESVVVQSPPPHQIICVNDGSTDESEAVVKAFAKQYPQLSWVHISQKNKGLGAARNAALSQVTGDYIAWLDADDAYAAEAFSHLEQYKKDNPIWVAWAAWEWNGDASYRKRFWRPSPTLNDLLVGGNPFLPSATMLHTETARTFPFTENRSMHGAEDLDLWIRLLHAGISPVQLDLRLTKYRIHSSAMSQDLEQHFRNILKVLDTYELDPRFKRKAIQRKYYEMARVLQRRGDHQRAAVYYAKSESKSLKTFILRMMNGVGVKV